MLKQFTADHRYLLDCLTRDLGFVDPVAIELDVYADVILGKAKRGSLKPIDGVLIRDWDPTTRQSWCGTQFGIRLYEIEGIRFARVQACHHHDLPMAAFQFYAVARKDYVRLYRIAVGYRREVEKPTPPPVLPEDQVKRLWANTIGYLEEANLAQIRAYGGRPRRGLLLTGPPGNGKTMACRWLWEECRERRWEWRLVSPDAFRQAQQSCNRVEAVRELFTLERRGIIFFDDMDVALRDRDRTADNDDQSVFLTALDGIAANEGIAYVFTTNCSLDRIDAAFKRPGRLDLVLHFEAPGADLRRRLLERWHEEIVASLELDRAVRDTEGFSFAEIDELKNLLIMRRMDVGLWDWEGSLKQFGENREELKQRRRNVGFGLPQGHANGTEVSG